ncbi:MAG: hypothetical protein NT023_12725, partial [Armatimonadetes bacterium]|nr:hypothetical protein [Armatimonadota bacterium]
MELEELDIEVLHPEQGDEVNGIQPIQARVYFKNLLNDKDRTRLLDIAAYSMTWSVDDEKQSQMQRTYGKEGDHFRANLDTTQWKWNFSGCYRINIRAEIPELGVLLATRDIATPNRWKECPAGDTLTLAERRKFQEGWA